MSTKFVQTVQRIRDLEKELEGIIKDAFKEFLTEYPEFKAVAWYQYTPYFNDGDPCEFSIGEIGYITDEVMEEYGWEDIEEIEPGELYGQKYDGPDYNAYIHAAEGNNYYKGQIEEYNKKLAKLTGRERELTIAWNDFRNALQSVPDGVMQAAFDNHVTIIAHKDGFIINEYHHD